MKWLDGLEGYLPSVRAPMQPQLLAARERINAHVRRLLLQAPTGGGKTTSASVLAALMDAAGGHVVVGVPRTKLCAQFSERLKLFNVPHSILAADKMFRRQFDDRLRVHVVMGPTLARRVGHMEPPRADLLIVDEAHLWGARTFAKLIHAYAGQGALIVGLTATPCREDGTPLDQLFDEMVLGPSYEELLAAGALVEPVCCSTPTQVDLSKLTIRAGDYDRQELSAAMSTTLLVGGIVENWRRRAAGRKTLCFAVDTRHGSKIVDAFRAAQVGAELVSHQNDEEELNAALGRLKRGEVQVVVSCTKLSYGVDEPFVDAVIMARPTRSITLWLQACGRALRAYPGKQDAVILDHGDCIANLCHPRDPIEWSLHHPPRKPGKPIYKPCIDCHVMIPVGCTVCPYCGADMHRHFVEIVASDDELEEVIPVSQMRPERFAAEAKDWYCKNYPQRTDRWRNFVRAVLIDRFGRQVADSIDMEALQGAVASPALCGLMVQRVKAYRAKQMQRLAQQYPPPGLKA